MWSNLNRKDRRHLTLVDRGFVEIALQNQEMKKKIEFLVQQNYSLSDELSKLDSKTTEILQNLQAQITGNKELKEEICKSQKSMELILQQVSLLRNNLVETEKNLATKFAGNLAVAEKSEMVLLQDILPNVTAIGNNAKNAMATLDEIKSKIEHHNQLIYNTAADMQKVAIDLRNDETANKLSAKLENVLQEIGLLDQSTRLILMKSVLDSIENASKDSM